MTHQPPSDITPPDAKERLAPFRSEIDDIDAQIVALLGKRFAIVRHVAALKAEHGIAPILSDRIEEVVRNARDAAKIEGLDPELAERLYRLVLDASCRLEENFIASGAVGAR